MKIAIYSGVIPSTTFVENLIQEVSKKNQVLLFGTQERAVTYISKNVRIVDTPKSVWENVPVTLFRTLKLLVKSPKLVSTAAKESMKYSGWYIRWMRFARFVPVLLYQPEVFHLQWVSKIDRWTFLKETYDCKLVVSLLGTHINISPIVSKQVGNRYKQHFSKVDVFHTINKKMGNEALKYGADPKKVRKVYTILNHDLFNANSSLKTWNPQKKIKIVSVGRYHWVKGYKYALQALSILLKQGVEAHYTIIASGKPTEELLYQVHHLNLEKAVSFKEPLVQNLLFEQLKEHDLFLLPSLSEGIANVALEAMMVGLPVVSTKCGGMPEVIEHEFTGWLVPTRNPETIARQVEQIVNSDGQLIDRVTQQAYEKVKQNFNPKKIACQMLELYQMNKSKVDAEE